MTASTLFTYNNTDKLSIREYLSYGFADFTQTAAVQFTSLYVLYFYTDIVMVSATVVGSIFAFSRLWDAINDPLMGMLIDRTSSRFGRCRPYFIPMSVLLALALMFIFSTPELDGVALIAFVIVSYNLFNMAYTATNLPITVQLPLISADKTTRIRLSAVRTFSQALAYTFLPFVVEKMLSKLGGHQSADAYFTIAVCISIFVVISFIYAFKYTQERIAVKPEKIGRSALKAIFFSQYDWLIILVVNALMTVGMIARFSSGFYHFTYNVGDTTHFGIFMTVLTASMLPCAVFAAFLADRIGKRNYAIIGALVGIVGNIILLLDANSFSSLLIGGFLAGCATGAFLSVLFAMIGDVADKVESLTNIKAIGTISAASALGYKTGLGLGTALVGWLLGQAGYIPNAAKQSAEVLAAIDTVFLIIPLVVPIISIALLMFYKEHHHTSTNT